MQLVNSLANAFKVSHFDVIFFFLMFVGIFVMYYFVSLRKVYSVAFGAIVGLGIFILLKVLLLSNPSMGTSGGLLPFGFSVFIVSIAVYFVFILAVVFPMNGSLVISETTNPVLYMSQFFFVAGFLILGFFAVVVYMIEQAYIFQTGTIFVWLRDWAYYLQSIRISRVFNFVMTNQNILLPLAVVLMIYKIFLSNLVAAIVLSIVYNLSRVGFYKKSEESSYRVEFHEIGAEEKNDE